MQFLAKDFQAKAIPSNPGVYQFFDKADAVLYVGKAINLRKRLTSYFRANINSAKTARLMAKAHHLSCLITQSEQEALLLEANLIKEHKPPYNILFRDDKSYPFLHLSEHNFPCLQFYRGRKKPKGDYFGPYASPQAVFETLHLMQTVFKLRQCSDSFFANRSRPCLQYQINRCSAPCVGLISQQEYSKDIHKVKEFLKGGEHQLVRNLQQEMQQHANNMAYEKAAKLRDQIRAINAIREKQAMVNQQLHIDVDIVVFAHLAGVSCIQLAMLRKGWQLGSKTIWLKQASTTTGNNTSTNDIAEDALESFLSHYYHNHDIPKEILLSQPLTNVDFLRIALSDIAQKPVLLKSAFRGVRAQLFEQTQKQAMIALEQRVDQQQLGEFRLNDLQQLLHLSDLPRHIECFDISHTSGQHTKASVVVFKQGCPSTGDYRMMNINHISAGDDYAAMKQALMRRYQRLKQEAANLPDLLIVDGGKGQGKMAAEVLQQLQLSIKVVAVAKGEGRKPGLETLYLPLQDNEVVEVAARRDGFLLLLHIRDEAHRFAITGHRLSRNKRISQSVLDEIPGIGSKIKQKLIMHFGGVEPIKKVSAEDLATVHGVSRITAEKIYAYLHR